MTYEHSLKVVFEQNKIETRLSNTELITLIAFLGSLIGLCTGI